MCGIYGTTIRYNKQQITEKLERTSYRGPDKMGIWIDDNIIFGHNRLAIIDLDNRSNQPLHYNNRISIVFNGEIYNFQNLKASLSKKGYSFKTESDTEVICAAYLEYGKDCVTHFNGMFAFVIYDKVKNELFGARDRLGQKPFYYYKKGTAFEFASQLSSIQMFNNDLTISQKSITQYLYWGTIPDEESIFNNIKKLRAGYWFTFQIETGNFTTQKYWDIDSATVYEGSYKDAKENLHTILKDAVSSRLYADVPVGVFLSGGVDSSLMAAIATNKSNSKVKTFSISFNEAEYDESYYAQKVANHLDTDHLSITCDPNEGLQLIDNFSHYYDEPFADASALPSLLLAKHTRQHVTVALTGDGGDEAFLGYHRYNWIKQKNNYFKIPKTVRLLISKLLTIPNNKRLKIASEILSYKSPNKAYLKTLTNDGLISNLDELNLNLLEFDYLYNTNKNILEAVSDFDLKSYLNWDINTKVDRATMAFSLEARAPLLDYNVISFAQSLPTNFKFNNNTQKRILKDILYDYVPKSFFNRPKSGFGVPLASWFKNELKSYVLDELNQNSLKSIPNINAKCVEQFINDHMTNTWDYHTSIWKLLVLKQWLSTNGAKYSIN